MKLVDLLLEWWIALTVLVVLGLAIWTAQRRADYEHGLQPIYEERCSVQRQLSIFCRVSLYDTFMVVAFLGKARIFYSDIEEVLCKRMLFSKGIYIKTRGGHWMFPSSIKFSPHNADRFMATLNAKVLPGALL